MKCETAIDPRIRRTRQMLFAALREHLKERSFDAITMQDIADRSTVNRGTIYAHFKDKFALLEALIAEDFGSLFAGRMAGSSGACRDGVRQLILAVCDYLGAMSCCQQNQRPFEPMVESTVRAIVQSFLLEALRHGGKVRSCSDAQLRATAASWAICGTVLDWSRNRAIPAQELAESVLPLVAAGLFLPETVPAPGATPGGLTASPQESSVLHQPASLPATP
jgi:AcrR family transcriptional regulator